MKYMKKLILPVLVSLVAVWSCNDPYANSTYQIYDVNPVSTYLETRTDDFSEWIALLKFADLFNAVNQATQSFTVFVPDNEAVLAFYKRKGVSSIEELGKEYAYNLACYHIIGDSISLDEFIAGGKLDKRTLSDDYLTVTFDENSSEGGGFNSIYINKEARVTETAIQVSNGFVYVLNAVLSPLIETAYERISEAGAYGIFKEALDVTAWGDSLNIIYDVIKQPNGSTLTRKRDYTVLAVSDEVFRNAGIASLTDLVAKLGADNDYHNPENELFRYVAYHIIKGNYSIYDLYKFENGGKKRLWGTMADAVMEISQEDDNLIYINYAGGSEIVAQFVEDVSDVQAKNGVLHRIDGYLPIWESEIPVIVYFDFCNYPEIASYIKSNGTEGQTYQTETSSTEYRTEITSLPCYTVEIGPTGPATLESYNYVDYFTVKASSNWTKCLNKDQLILNIGYMGSISMQTPALIKGKYKATLYFCYATTMDFIRTQTSGSNGGQMQFSFDGENKITASPYTTVSANTLDLYNVVLYDELEFEKTASHTFKIVVMDPTASSQSKFRIQLDYLLFEPIIN
ncbi:MAG: DUF5108 domain-containing protein [Dysgonamonadaceae bacterium]|jgi:uncharacterized surface protein with fasciclin (FAS1) repeats|nr:DUF5108 domain-containing protein [Dysgonamonadaceae bacterium]